MIMINYKLTDLLKLDRVDKLLEIVIETTILNALQKQNHFEVDEKKTVFNCLKRKNQASYSIVMKTKNISIECTSETNPFLFSIILNVVYNLQ